MNQYNRILQRHQYSKTAAQMICLYCRLYYLFIVVLENVASSVVEISASAVATRTAILFLSQSERSLIRVWYVSSCLWLF